MRNPETGPLINDDGLHAVTRCQALTKKESSVRQQQNELEKASQVLNKTPCGTTEATRSRPPATVPDAPA